MKENNKSLPALSNFVPKVVKNIKYSKKVKVADIKQYLVDEYKLTKKLDKENRNLRKELNKVKLIEEKYDLTLITLDEYKNRISDKNEEIKELNDKLKGLKDELKFIKDEKNTLIIENKKLQREKDNEKIIKDFKKDYNKQLIEKIQNTKGTLSKAKVYAIIED